MFRSISWRQQRPTLLPGLVIGTKKGVSSSPDTHCLWDSLEGEGLGVGGWGARVAVVTQRRAPLFQQLHFHQLVDRGRVLQPLDQGIHQVVLVAREDAQVVPRLVLQLLMPIGVETHEDG